MRKALPKRHREPTITLINIVFLMLVFFLFASQVAPPLPNDLTLPSSAELQTHHPADAVVLSADGVLSFRGEAVDMTALPEQAMDGDVLRLAVDQNAQASRLIEVAAELRASGAETVRLITEVDE